MTLKGKRIGIGITGSHNMYHKVFPQIQHLMDSGATVIPIVSDTVKSVDTVYGKAKDHIRKIESITNKKVISTMIEAEALGPKRPLDCMVIAPLTGNSLSKLAHAFSDTPVLFAAKSTIRNQKPLVLGISTNDALGLNGVNVMKLMSTKQMYFIPFGQDNPDTKPNSMTSKMDLLMPTVESALKDKQLQPIIVPYLDESMVK